MPYALKADRDANNRRHQKRRYERWGQAGNHHLSPEQVAVIREFQNDGCALCGKPLADGRWVFDHDHTCCPGVHSCGKCIRGLLCQACNVMEGAVTKAVALGYVTPDGFLLDYLARSMG